MANVVVEEQSLIDIASAIRTKNETDNTYKPSEMANAILDITTGGEVVEPVLQEKSVTPTTSSQTITPDTSYDGLSKVTVNAVTSAIDSDIKATNIRSGVNILGVTGSMKEYVAPKLQSKSVTPKTTSQTINADSGYDGLSSVSVGAVTNSIDSNITSSNIKSGVSILGVEGTLEEGITPSGELTINDNGIYNVTNYASANVEIEKGITPSGTLEITSNGTYDVTEYASTNVNVPSSGGVAEDHLDEFLTNTLTAIDSDVTKIVSYGSYGRTALNTVNLPKCTDIGSYAFRGCSGITNVNAPLVTNIATYGFYGCSKLTDINMPNLSSLGTYAFYKCDLRSVNFPNVTSISQNAFFQNENLQIADFGVASKINQAGFGNCESLVALILRRTSSICTLGVATNGFSGTPIAEGTGYVYVPRDLVDTYKTATNWVNYATQFRALEDYTVDGTITGALDETKI